MKVCKADGIGEYTSYWTSDNYTRRLSHEEKGRRTNTHFSKERGGFGKGEPAPAVFAGAGSGEF
jgi:hypothetical protein